MAQPTRLSPLLASIMLAGVGLAGCSSVQDSTLPACPAVSVLADAGHMQQFRDGPGRDLTDLVLEAKLGPITGECSYNRKQTEVTVAMKLAIEARRGPASTAKEAKLDYFVAVIDNSDTVLARQEFSTLLTFPATRGAVAGTEELEQRIPLKENEFGDAYRVLIGFKLTQDQLDRNRLFKPQ